MERPGDRISPHVDARPVQLDDARVAADAAAVRGVGPALVEVDGLARVGPERAVVGVRAVRPPDHQVVVGEERVAEHRVRRAAKPDLDPPDSRAAPSCRAQRPAVREERVLRRRHGVRPPGEGPHEVPDSVGGRVHERGDLLLGAGKPRLGLLERPEAGLVAEEGPARGKTLLEEAQREPPDGERQERGEDRDRSAFAGAVRQGPLHRLHGFSSEGTRRRRRGRGPSAPPASRSRSRGGSRACCPGARR